LIASARVAMIAMEDYFSQHELGLLSEEQFSRGVATFCNTLKELALPADRGLNCGLEKLGAVPGNP